MNAYDAVNAVTNFKDVVIPMRVSVFCALFDYRLTACSRQQLLDDTVSWLMRNPEGIDVSTQIAEEVQPDQAP